jgi:dolichol-phosphate mannosyltransferase
MVASRLRSRICPHTHTARAVSGGANLLARHLGRLPVRDCTSGFRCYSSDLVKDLIGSVTREGFNFQIDALMNAVRMGYRVREHPICFRDRETGESKLGLREYLSFLMLMFSRIRL